MMPALSFDPSSLFAKKLVDPLLNHMRSTSAQTRADAVLLWKALSKICHDENQMSTVCSNAGKLLTSGKVTSWEHRILVYQAIASLADSALPGVSSVASEVYVSMSGKEANEQALAAAIFGLGRHLAVLTSCQEVLSKFKLIVEKSFKAMGDGLASNKALARKSWAMALADLVMSSPHNGEHLADVLPKLLTALFSTFKKIADKPLAWKDGPMEAFILIAIVTGKINLWSAIPSSISTILKAEKYPTSILSCSPKASFFLLDRVFTKATSTEEGHWFVVALESTLGNISIDTLEKNKAVNYLAQAFIWVLTSHPEHTVRREAYKALQRLAKKIPQELGTVIRSGLNTWLRDVSIL
jgi:hypothetical protein